MAPPARTITVALDMSKAFDTINIHTLIRNVLQTKIPGTIIKFIANYIKGLKAYTTYRNHTSSQRQFKLAIHKVASFRQHYSTFTLQTYHYQEHQFMSWPTLMTSTHTCTSATKKYIQPYLHKAFAWAKQNNPTLNPDKTTCTLFTPDPAEYKNILDLIINNIALPKGSGLYLRLKTNIQHTPSQHLSTSTQATTNDKALTATGWGKQEETLMATYKAVMRPALEYASSIWSPLASSTSIN